ncbi:MAG: rhodanese-like domain-containing protein [Patescibacteria group bacterium]
MKHATAAVVAMLPVALLSGIAGGYLAIQTFRPDTETLIRDFYATENAVHVSPHSIRKKIAEGAQDFVLVDLRSREEYEKEHITGAVSIPAYKDKDHSDYGAVDRIVGEFQKLGADKDIIVYCYSMPCMTGRKIGQMLTEHDIYVQHLGIGWNEWRHFWQLWNHEHEWAKTKAEEYISTGEEPGSFKGVASVTPCVEGQFGC